jgi:hypothetical protein
MCAIIRYRNLVKFLIFDLKFSYRLSGDYNPLHIGTCYPTSPLVLLGT